MCFVSYGYKRQNVECEKWTFQRGTNELKKYLKSRLAETPNDVTEKAQGLRKSKGMSGIIAGPQEGVDAFSVHSTKALDYR